MSKKMFKEMSAEEKVEYYRDLVAKNTKRMKEQEKKKEDEKKNRLFKKMFGEKYSDFIKGFNFEDVDMELFLDGKPAREKVSEFLQENLG